MDDPARMTKEEYAQKLAAAYLDGFRAGHVHGLRQYAWWKDGVEYVGTCGTTLKKAIENALKGAPK